MKSEQRPRQEAPSQDASRGEQFAHPILDGDTQSVHDAIERAAALYFDRPGRVVELRALHVRTARGTYTASGYFDNPKDFVEAAMQYDGRAAGVYATLNIVAPELLARAHNRVEEYAKTTTGDANVSRRVRFLIDVDPVRASGISSTDAQLDEARNLARLIVDYLTRLGFPEPALGISGNGAHIIYAIDLPVDAGELLERCLQALAFRFNTATLLVDETVYKAAQLARVYGTLACKGDAIADRPHRRSYLKMPEGGLQIATVEVLDRLAATLPLVDAKPGAPAARGPRFDVEPFLQRLGIEVVRSGAWQGGTRWILAVCPFNPEHADAAAFVAQFASGAVAAGCLHNSCKHWGWRELRQRFDPDFQSGADTSAGSAGTHEGPSWDIQFVPQPVPTGLLPVPGFPAAVLPNALRDWLVDISERIGCPLDYPAIGAIVGMSSLVGRKVAIKPMRCDDWTVIANLWGAIIGRPGLLKTPALRQVLKPLQKLEQGAQAEYRIQVDDHEAKLIAWRKRRDRVGGKDVDNLDDDQLLDHARHIVEQQPQAPPRPRFIVNDPSYEKLGEILRDNTNGVLIFRDELVGLLRKLDKEGNEEARTFFLEAWNGDGSYTFDRIGRGTITVPHLILSVLGGIQPNPMLGYMFANARSGAGDDGLFQRFQLFVWPDRRGKWNVVDRVPDSAAMRSAQAVYKRLSELTGLSVGAEFDTADLDATPWLRFSDDAQERFLAWRNEWEERLLSGEYSDALESHFAKYRSLIPSLALLFHLIDNDRGPVGLPALDRAIAFGDYLAAHARRIYGAIEDVAGRVARLLANRISAGEVQSPFSLKSIYDRGWSGLTDPEEVKRGVVRLESLGWVQLVVRKPGIGRAAHEYWIHPNVPRTPTWDASKTSGSAGSSASAGSAGSAQGDSEDIDDDGEVVA